MSKKMFWALILACYASPLFAAVTVFDQNATINSNYNKVSIEKNAVVTITGGEIDVVYVLNNATLNFSGGTLKRLYCYDDCQVNILGTAKISETFDYNPNSSHGTFEAYGNSEITMTGGQIIGGPVFYGSSILKYYGGIIKTINDGIDSGSSPDFYHNSKLYFYSGDPGPGLNTQFQFKNNSVGYILGGNIKWIGAEGHAELNISGGTIYGVSLRDDVKAYLSGGSITSSLSIESEPDEGHSGFPAFHVYGTNLTAKPYGYTGSNDYEYGMLSGKWLNDVQFSMKLDSGSYPWINLHEGESPPDTDSTGSDESAGTLQIDSFKFSRGKTLNSDSLAVLGRIILQNPSLNLSAQEITVQCGDLEATLAAGSLVRSGSKNVFTYKRVKGSTSPVSTLVIDLTKGTFVIGVNQTTILNPTGAEAFRLTIGGQTVEPYAP